MYLKVEYNSQTKKTFTFSHRKDFKFSTDCVSTIEDVLEPANQEEGDEDLQGAAIPPSAEPSSAAGPSTTAVGILASGHSVSTDDLRQIVKDGVESALGKSTSTGGTEGVCLLHIVLLLQIVIAY